MQLDDVVAFLRALGVPKALITRRSNWTLCPCPLAPWRHEKGLSNTDVFGVRDDPGDAFVNCFACQFHGTQGDLLAEMHRLHKKEAHAEPDFKAAMQLVLKAEEEFDLPGLNSPDIEEMLFGGQGQFMEFPSWWMETYVPATEVDYACEYLRKRRTPLEIVQMLELRCDTEQRRICFPVKDFSGTAMGLHGRAILPQTEPRYRMYTYQKRNNPLIWLGEDWVDFDKPVVIAEGPFDLARIMQVYRNVVSPLFANPSIEKLKRMSAATEIVTFLDTGTGGDRGRQRISEIMSDSEVVHVMPKGAKDPGDMEAEEVAEALEKLVPLDDILID